MNLSLLINVVLQIHILSIDEIDVDVTLLDLRSNLTQFLSERQSRTESSRLYVYVGFLQSCCLYELELAVVIDNDTSDASVAQSKVHEILIGDELVRLKLELPSAGSKVLGTGGQQRIFGVGHHLALEGVMGGHGKTRGGEATWSRGRDG